MNNFINEEMIEDEMSNFINEEMFVDEMNNDTMMRISIPVNNFHMTIQVLSLCCLETTHDTMMLISVPVNNFYMTLLP